MDGFVAAVPDAPALDVRAIIAPHAGIMFSGPVAAYAYKAAAAASPYDVIALVGPSHFDAFEGVALYPGGAFDSPLGLAQIDGDGVAALAESAIVRKHKGPHDREHSLEMQIPFLRRLLPDVPIVPMLMGFQRRQTILDLAAGLTTAFKNRRTLLVASTDLSHYFDAETAAAYDGRVSEFVDAFDPEGLLDLFEVSEHERGRYVACGRSGDRGDAGVAGMGATPLAS